MYRSYYGDVTRVEKEGERGVRFTFKSADNRELPQIVGEMPVLSKRIGRGAISATRRSTRRSAAAHTKIESIDPGRSITYRGSPITGRSICRSAGAATTST